MGKGFGWSGKCGNILSLRFLGHAEGNEKNIVLNHREENQTELVSSRPAKPSRLCGGSHSEFF